MAENRQVLIHLHNSANPLTNRDLIKDGELALMHNDVSGATIYARTADNKLAEFGTKAFVELTVSAAQTDIQTKLEELSGATEDLSGATVGIQLDLVDLEGAFSAYTEATDDRLNILETSAHYHTNKTVLDGITGEQVEKWDDALQSISKGTDGDYVTTTIATKANNDQSVGVAVTVVDITAATASNKGLAEASNVKDYVDTVSGDLDTKINTLSANVVTTINEKTAGVYESATTFTTNAIEALDGDARIATLSEGVVTLKAGVIETNGVISNSADTDITLAKVATTGAAEDVSVPASGNLTSTNVKEALYELQGDIDNLTSDSEVTLEVASSATEGYLKTYILSQGGEEVGKIDIPKDFVVKSGEVKTVEKPDVPYTGAVVGDKYLDFVINVVSGSATDEHMYIPVKDLVDVYTGDNETIVVSTGNVISVKENVFDLSGAADTVKTYVDSNFATSAATVNEIANASAATLTAAKTYADGIYDSATTFTTNAINELDATATAVTINGKAITLANTIVQTDGTIAAGNETTTLADVAKTGKAEDVTIDDTADKFTATNVEGALSELKGDIDAVSGYVKTTYATSADTESAIATAKNEAIASANSYTDSALTEYLKDVKIDNSTPTATAGVTATKDDTTKEVTINFENLIIDCGTYE